MEPEERTALEDRVRRAIHVTYSETGSEDVDFVDVRYETFDRGSHLLRARAPDHELLEFGRWMVVTIDGDSIELRGDGHASPTEYYVRVRHEPDR